MTQNMGTVDRVIRIAAAVGVAILYATGVISGTLGVVLGVLAAVFLVTGLVGVCPLYILFKISTRKKV